MTTFSYTLVLNDTESIALEGVLNMFLEQCEQHQKTAPYIAWEASVRNIKSRLYANMRQTSGHTFDPETGNFQIWIGAEPGQGEKDT